MGTVLTTLNPGQSYAAQSKSEQTLDSYGNIVQSKAYDYGNLTTPARTYNFTYLTDSNYISRYIRNRVTQVTVTPEIDRITATLRPGWPVVGRQHWRDLLFLHWPVPVEVLRPLIPESLSIDTYDGQAYIGLVPFWMFGVRPNWSPERLGFRFLETNVRTYTTGWRIRINAAGASR